jgi:hypothetical protein
VQRDDGRHAERHGDDDGDSARDDAAAVRCSVGGPPQHGEELGTAAVTLGDDREKGGENVWISRIAIDRARREAQSVSSSETKARRTSSDHRKVEAREAQREAARRNSGKPREHRKVGSRDGSEPRKGSVT